jgi:hypothetical protein
MPPEVPREALDLAGQLHDLVGDVVLDGGLDRPPGVDLPGPGVELAGGVAEGPAHVADGRAGLVGDHVGDLGGPVAAVALVDVLDDLLAPAGLDVQVDVGRPVALGRQEPLEQQAEGDGVGLGDPDGVADRRVGRRAPALAVDVGPAAELDDVPDDQEVAGEAELLDGGQLVVDLAPGARHPLRRPGAVAAGRALAGQLAQPGHLGVAGRDREVGQAGGDQLQVEGQRPAELGGQLDRARVAGQVGRLLEPGPEMGAGPGGQPAVQVGQGAAGPDRGQGGGQAAAGRGGVVDVVGRHHLDPRPVGQADQGVVAGRVQRVAVVPQLHIDVVPAERLDEPVQRHRGRRRPPLLERARHRPLPAAGQHHPVTAVQFRQPPQVAQGRPLGPRQLRLRDRPAQPGIPLRVARQHHQMLPRRIGSPGPPLGRPWSRSPVLRRPRRSREPGPLARPVLFGGPGGAGTGPGRCRGGGQGELGAEDGGEGEGPGGFGEAHDAVHAVVVGEGQGLQAEPDRLLDQLLGVGAAVQEAGVGMAMELRIGDLGRSRTAPSPGLVGLAPGRPGRGVPAVGAGGLVVRRRGTPGEPAFQLAPGERRILPSHAPMIERMFGP